RGDLPHRHAGGDRLLPQRRDSPDRAATVDEVTVVVGRGARCRLFHAAAERWCAPVSALAHHRGACSTWNNWVGAGLRERREGLDATWCAPGYPPAHQRRANVPRGTIWGRFVSLQD